jgi:tetrahydromethanopterin S-methyltransferase subunit G
MILLTVCAVLNDILHGCDDSFENVSARFFEIRTNVDSCWKEAYLRVPNRTGKSIQVFLIRRGLHAALWKEAKL